MNNHYLGRHKGADLGRDKDSEAGKDKPGTDWGSSSPEHSVDQDTSGDVEEQGYRHNHEQHLGQPDGPFDTAPRDLCVSTRLTKT
jgi:hypothetical protein